MRQQVALLSLILSCMPFVGCDGPKPNTIPNSAVAYLDAQKHFAAGENDRALEAVNASISQEPSPWAYFLRARLHVQFADDAAALKDCEAGLQLAPDDTSLAWLKGELAKPAATRFQGQFKNPPTVDR